MATDAQKRRLAKIDASLVERIKAWWKEHDITANEMVAVVVSVPIRAMLEVGKTEEEILDALKMILRCTRHTIDDENTEAAKAVINTRRPRLIAGGN